MISSQDTGSQKPVNGQAARRDYSSDQVAKARDAIAVWQSKLLDVSKGNRLLRFRTTKLTTVSVVAPSLPTLLAWLIGNNGSYALAPKPSQERLLGVHSNEAPAPSSPPNTLLCDAGTDKLWAALYNLRQKSQAAIEERGVNILFLALGFLCWDDPQEKDVRWRAPLILVPVTLERVGADNYRIHSLDEETILNPTLDHKLSHDHLLTLPELPDDLESFDLLAYFTKVKTSAAKLPGVAIEEDAYVGLFQFLKIAMYHDLASQTDALLTHSLTGRLAGLPVAVSESGFNIPPEGRLDPFIDPHSTFQVLDADSSQQESLAAARHGASMVLQGPPGTGKSQTIANLIVEAVADGKKVLFVSEKEAALQVVKRRLDDCGLGEICLELHGHQANKKQVLENLRQALENVSVPNTPQADAMLDTLTQTRDTLNGYAESLHRPRFASGLTAFQVYGRLCQLRSAPQARYRAADVEAVTWQTLLARRSLLETLSAHAGVIDRFNDHPWRGLRGRPPSAAFQSELSDNLEALRKALQSLLQLSVEAVEATGLRWPDRLGDLARLQAHGGKWNFAVLKLPLGELAERFSGSYAGAARVLRPGYWRDRDALRALYREKWAFKVPDLAAELTELALLQSRLVGKGTEVPDDGLCRRYLDRLSAPLEATTKALDYFRPLFFAEGTVHVAAEESLYGLLAWCEQHAAGLSEVDPYLRYVHDYDDACANGLSPFVDAALGQPIPAASWPDTYFRACYETWLDRAYAQAPELAFFSHDTHEQKIEQFRKLDTGQFRIARQQVMARVISARPPVDPAVRYAPSSEIAILMREFNKKARIKPLRRLFGEAPNAILALKPCLMMSPLSVSTFLQPDRFAFDLVIFDEASQVRVEDSIGSIVRGKQLVVAGDRCQLPPTRFFDTMTLGEDQDTDEENISDVYESILDALGGFLPARELRWHYRSRNEGLIAFSNKEFYDFKLYTFPHPDQAGADQGISFVFVPEGVYERGSTRRNVPEARRVVARLLEHARRTPEWSLAVVTFSEAQRETIQQLLNQELGSAPDVRPFFESAHPAEPFRIKNLELIQGDERDVIVFSLGYGRDESGAPPALNFGPLNQEGGRRRLNVAVTRAKQKVIVVSSMQPEDLARSDNEGVRLLREYLFLARDGLSALHTTTGQGGDVESPLEASVLASLRAARLEVHPQVGVSGYRIDLGIVDPITPGRYCLGVECDGATYHSARTARDRDRLRQAILEGLGWNIHRIWSHDWNADPERELRRVLERVQACAGKGKPTVKVPSGVTGSAALSATDNRKQPVQENATHEATSTASVTGQRAYGMTVPNLASGKASQPVPAAAPLPNGEDTAVYSIYGGPIHSEHALPFQLVDDVVRIVKAEGPVHREAVMRRIATGWGVGRIGSRIRETLTKIVEEAVRERAVRLSRDRHYLWPKDEIKVVPRKPWDGDERRPMDEICPEEIAAAVKVCLKRAYGSVSRGDLVILVVRLFGYQRVTDSLSTPVEAVVDDLLKKGEIEVKNGLIQASR